MSRKTDSELPPNAPESEAGAIGVLLLSPELGMDLAGERGVTHLWFYDLRHQTIWLALAAMHEQGKAIDRVLLHQWLKDNGKLRDSGGAVYVATVGGDDAFSIHQLGGYLDVLREKFVLRAVQRVGTEMVKAVREIEEGERVEPGTLLERVEKEVLKLSEEGGTATETLIAEAVAGVMARLEDYHRGNVQLQGLTTGIEFVDKMLCGIGGDDNGNYYVLSGRPGTGKTAWALQIADHVATEHVWWEPILVDGPNGKKTPLVELADGPMGQVERFKCERRVGRPVVVFSLEMSLHGLTARLLFRRARVNAQNMRTGFGTKEEFERLRDAWELFAKGNRIVIEDKGCYEFESLKAKARRMARQYGAKLIVVDYLQLTESSDRKLRENRVLELAWISKSIQRLGKELRIPLLVLAQMNRDYEKEVTRPPRLSDLKDCGQVEQDADVVGFLYQPRMKQKTLDIYREAMGKIYGEKNEADWPMRVDLLIAKARNGKTGACRLLFERNFTNFLDWHAWLKGHGLAAPAKGEEPQYRDRELPTNEEMDL